MPTGRRQDLPDEGRRRRRADRRRPRGRRGRVRLAHRPVRLRQVDAAASDRRPRPGRPRDRIEVFGKTPVEGARRPGVRHRVPAGRAAAVAHGRRQHRAAARAARHRQGGARGPRRRARRARRPVRLRRPLPRPAVGRHAAARRDRPRVRRAPAPAAHGRAVRRARRDDPRVPADRARAHRRRDRRGRRVRDALDPRGRVPLGPRRRDEPAARPHHRRSSRPTLGDAARRGAARVEGLLRARSPPCARRCTARPSRGRTSDDRHPLPRLGLRFVAPIVVGRAHRRALARSSSTCCTPAPRALPSPIAIGAEIGAAQRHHRRGPADHRHATR